MSFDPKDRSVWATVNSPFVVSIVATVLLGGLGWFYTAVVVPKVEENARYNRLIGELEFRMALAKEKSDRSNSVTVLNGRDPRVYVFVEFQGRPLYSLLIELESLGWYRQPDIKAALKRLTVSINSESLPEVYQLLDKVIAAEGPLGDPQHKAELEEWAGRN